MWWIAIVRIDTMAFKFDFALDANQGPASHEDDAASNTGATGATLDVHARCTQLPSPQTTGIACGQIEHIRLRENLQIAKVVLSSSAAALLGHSQQIQQNDVVAGEYEGGFKLWEGGVDLAAHVANLWQVDFTPSNSSEAAVMQGHHVLELGCGAGLPGAVALLAGAQQVVFQDYNAPVLEHVTMANVAANFPTHNNGSDVYSRARFVQGPWATFPAWLTEQDLVNAFDVVLTAETIYDPANVPALLQCIVTAMKPATGVCYLAAKSYYFGVGGSTAHLHTAAAAVGLSVVNVCILDDGRSNKREVLTIRWAAQGGEPAAGKLP